MCLHIHCNKLSPILEAVTIRPRRFNPQKKNMKPTIFLVRRRLGCFIPVMKEAGQLHHRNVHPSITYHKVTIETKNPTKMLIILENFSKRAQHEHVNMNIGVNMRQKNTRIIHLCENQEAPMSECDELAPIVNEKDHGDQMGENWGRIRVTERWREPKDWRSRCRKPPETPARGTRSRPLRSTARPCNSSARRRCRHELR